MVSTKLAGTFKAHRVSICVEKWQQHAEVVNRCAVLGLQPIFSGNRRSGLIVNVVVPFRDKELERPDSAMDVLRETLTGLNVRFDGKPTEVELVCPPDYAPVKSVGVCSHCRKIFPVVAREHWDPPEFPALMVARHEITVTGITGVCPGSARAPFE